MQRSIAFREGNAMGVCTLGQQKESQLEVFVFQAHDERPLLAVLKTLWQGWGRQKRKGTHELHCCDKV